MALILIWILRNGAHGEEGERITLLGYVAHALLGAAMAGVIVGIFFVAHLGRMWLFG